MYFKGIYNLIKNNIIDYKKKDINKYNYNKYIRYKFIN